MKKIKSFLNLFRLIIFALIFFHFPGIVWPDNSRRLIELTFSWGLNSQNLSSSYQHQYSPPFESGEALSSGSHYLDLNSAKARGKFISLGLFPLKNLGVEIGYFYQSSPIDGQSSEYEVSIEYTSRPPPSYQPVKMTLNFKHAWPSPHGQLALKVLQVNPSLRLGEKSNWQLGLSSGVSFFFLKGELGPLAFTRFWLGGHSVLFSEEYKILARFVPNHRIGWNAGATIAYRLFAGLSLSIDFRYYSSPQIPLQLEAIDYDKDYEQQGIEPLLKIRPYLNLGQVSFRPSFFSLTLGLKSSFF